MLYGAFVVFAIVAGSAVAGPVPVSRVIKARGDVHGEVVRVATGDEKDLASLPPGFKRAIPTGSAVADPVPVSRGLKVRDEETTFINKFSGIVGPEI